jgi:hypothetical protein
LAYHLLSERQSFGKSAEVAERYSEPHGRTLIEGRRRITTSVEIARKEFHCLPIGAGVGAGLAQTVSGLHLKADVPESGCDRQRALPSC